MGGRFSIWEVDRRARQEASGPVASQTKENGRRREAYAYVELRLQKRIRREAEVVIPPTITHICW